MEKKAGLRWAWLLPLLPVLLGVLLLDSPGQRALRNSQFDQFQRWHPRVYEAVPVRVLDVDEESLARLGQWPWPRTRVAELLNKLGAAGVAAVGFDVLFAEPDRTSPKVAAEQWNLSGQQRATVLALPDHDAVLANSLEQGDAVLCFAGLDGAGQVGAARVAESRMPLQKSRFVYLGEPQPRWLHHFDAAVSSLPALEKAAKGNGAMNFVPDGDGVVRRVPLVFQMGGTPVGTLVSETLRVAQGSNNVVLKSAGHDSGLAEVRVGDAVIPTTAQGDRKSVV